MMRIRLRALGLVAAIGAISFALVAAAAGEAPRYYYPVPAADPVQVIEADVVVYGATPGGVMAAIQARRMGKTAVLVEFGRHVGGMTASGLSKTDGGKHAAGISREFYKVVGERDFPPAVAEAQFLRMFEADGVRLFREHRLKSVAKEGNRITQLEMENGNRFRGRMFIDATYEGDLLAKAGVSFTVGREANSLYGETINGVAADSAAHNFRFPVDPYRTPGDPASGLLKGISATGPGKLGDGDRHVQAYNFRMYLSKAASQGEGRGQSPFAPRPSSRTVPAQKGTVPGGFANPIAFPKPADYDPDRYTLLARYIAAGAKIADFMQLHEGDSNNDGGFSTDNICGSDAWPEADYATREKIYQDHVSYQQGLMWFVTHDERVPEAIRRAVGAYGLSPGDFQEASGWPHQLYVREGRRMVSDYVMTEHNCRGQTVAADSIGLAEYTMDSHHCQRCVVMQTDKRTGERRAVVRNEGDVQVRIPGPYPVAYQAIVPKQSECANLLVPVCLSASHIAYGSIRMEPVFMVLGQSAGTAAAMAIDGDLTVQQVDYAKLRARLLADHQMLDVR
jgi:FAD dependent oxidoreductase